MVLTTTGKCGGCQQLVGNVHQCPKCRVPMHPFCGTPVGIEGFGQPVICPSCHNSTVDPDASTNEMVTPTTEVDQTDSQVASASGTADTTSTASRSHGVLMDTNMTIEEDDIDSDAEDNLISYPTDYDALYATEDIVGSLGTPSAALIKVHDESDDDDDIFRVDPDNTDIPISSEDALLTGTMKYDSCSYGEISNHSSLNNGHQPKVKL